MQTDLYKIEAIRRIMPFVQGVWLHRLVVLIIACCLSMILWLIVLFLPSEYRASSKVFVDTESLVRPLLQGLTVNDDVLSDVQIMTRALTSRPQLEALARQTDLDITVSNPAEYANLLNNLSERISVQPDRQNVYEIGFTASSRDEAILVATQLLNNFVEDTVGSGNEDSEQAEQTLRRELESYEQRLVEAEDRLKRFKQENVGLMPNETGDYYNQLQEAIQDLGETEKQLRATRGRVRALENQLEGEEPAFGLISSTSSFGQSRPTRFDAEIKLLESKITDLLVEYTEKHPEVVRTRSRLEDLYAQREAEIAAQPIGTNPATGNLDINPIYQSLRIQLNDAEVEAVALSSEVAEKRNKVEELERLVDVVPAVETELNRLNRDYEVVTKRYQEMLNRWEDLQTSKRVSSDTDSMQFRVIDPPYSPSEPSGPPRVIFVIAATIFSVGVGLAVGLLMYLLKPVVTSATQLVDNYSIDVIGTISELGTAASLAHSRRNFIFTVFCVGILAGGTVTLSVFAETGSNLVQNLVNSI